MTFSRSRRGDPSHGEAACAVLFQGLLLRSRSAPLAAVHRPERSRRSAAEGRVKRNSGGTDERRGEKRDPAQLQQGNEQPLACARTNLCKGFSPPAGVPAEKPFALTAASFAVRTVTPPGCALAPICTSRFLSTSQLPLWLWICEPHVLT